MNRWGIKTRILALTLVPNIFITFFLCSYFTYKRISDQNDIIRERGSAIVNQLSQAINSENAFSKLEKLQLFANVTLNKKDVRSVIVYDSQEEPIVRAGPEMLINPENPPSTSFSHGSPSYETPETLRFKAQY